VALQSYRDRKLRFRAPLQRTWEYFNSGTQQSHRSNKRIPLELNQILNINVPNLPLEQIKGIKALAAVRNAIMLKP
jgi:broad specificity polyphosphatase/5'/3'-nucleotidase SurE